ncbi:uncharacterized protein HKW66_Vig0021410 [Vigna angularis]|uniref:Uncharacterized protein n=2 Tax=Phaseolus angularis TaxID=3914 RepID=A0A8T0L605_PHAAN|nr:uncharacterized protein HKW66_Vig0021410 [Vigna angularis]
MVSVRDGNRKIPKTNEFWHYIFKFRSVEMRNNSTAMAATGASCCLFALWRGQSGLDANPLTFLQRRQRYRLRSAYMLVLHCKQIGVLAAEMKMCASYSKHVDIPHHVSNA